jgi:hypothetical protein
MEDAMPDARHQHQRNQSRVQHRHGNQGQEPQS